MKNFWIFGITAAVWAVWKVWQSDESTESSTSHRNFEGFSVSRTSLPNNHEVVRFRGSYDDIMRALGVVEDEKPPLPSDLDIESLPEYYCGCPHCGAMSIVGENMWRYQELDRTRGYFNNTTTYLTKCKKCNGFMRCMVDHDD